MRVFVAVLAVVGAVAVVGAGNRREREEKKLEKAKKEVACWLVDGKIVVNCGIFRRKGWL